jgi:hypothetical protein
MANQVTIVNNSTPFIRAGMPTPIIKDGQTIATDGARTASLVGGTVMAKIAASGKWKNWQNEAATDGSAIPAGLYIGPDILAASLVAGDVVDCQILVGAAIIDKNQITMDPSTKALTTVIGGSSIHAGTVEDYLMKLGLYCEDTIDISGSEN